MKRIVKIALAAMLMLGMSSVTLSADASKGQKLFIKKLKKPCGMNGGKMAAKHSQDEWTELKEAGKIADELKKFCPKAKDKALKSKYLDHYYDFFFEYANDSGNVPSC